MRTLMKFGCDWRKIQPQKQVQERLREYISTKGGFPCFLNLFLSLHFIRRKNDILIYTAADSKHQYILKCSENIPSVRQALLDEYEGLSPLSHPSLPHYYGFHGMTSLCQEQAFLFLLFVWNTAKHFTSRTCTIFIFKRSVTDFYFSTGEVLCFIFWKTVFFIPTFIRQTFS